MTTHSNFRRFACAVAALGCLALIAVTVAAGGTEKGHEALVRKYVQIWNTGDLKMADTIIAADVTRRGPAPVFSSQGREGLKQNIARGRGNYKNFDVSIKGLKSDGNRVVLSWVCTGTYIGSEHPEAVGRKLEIPGTSAFRVIDGMIAHEDVSWDYLLGYEQLGIVDPVLDETTRNKDVVHKFTTELYEKGNMSAAYELVSDDFVYHVPAGKQGAIGPQGAQQRAAIFRTAFPDLKFRFGETIADGDLVAVRWTFRGTHRGTFLGYEQTGNRVAVSGLSLARLQDGKIVEAWGVWDRGDLIEQLGR